MVRRSLFLVLLVALIATLAGCGGGSNNNVNNLWSDVPGLPQAEKANIKLPLPLRLVMEAAVKASASDGNVNLDKFDVVGYTTSMTPGEVTDYYSQERMAEAGWNVDNQMGCLSGPDTGGAGGGMCMFGKDTGDQESLLVILPASDGDSGKTQVFYVRFDGQLSGN
ncbi:MAG: hypothetical protein H6649_09420 [Caldilineae bacterium]|nr:hypothetical protein [Anaerolineae bacterium]MCB0201769.1 hypothetical protein [Anaerolineae bacterium]MCB0205286.1 hypothetical protein [Anaerolineae bacterium]MCB0252294.1 hypothetical protein [Anaerolineae bacterium]MCB9154257.1 hypothetical protein [Caldilineae bacterium]